MSYLEKEAEYDTSKLIVKLINEEDMKYYVYSYDLSIKLFTFYYNSEKCCFYLENKTKEEYPSREEVLLAGIKNEKRKLEHKLEIIELLEVL